MEQKILKEISLSPHERIKVAVTDIDGILRGKSLLKSKFLSAAETGFGFCNVVFGWDMNDVCYDNSKYTGWHTGYPDADVRIDLSTHRNVPWDGGIPFFLGDFVDKKGGPLEICPRQLLKKVIQKSKDMGFDPNFGLEFEWFNFRETPQSLAAKKYIDPEPITPGMFGYSLLRSGLNRDFMNALQDELGKFRIPIEGLHTETGPGVLEAAILYSDALEAADRAVLFKTSAKEIAYRFGILPSFMAKWNVKLPGCGGHMHQSLWAGGKNVFYDEKDPNKMSQTFKQYIAGQQQCMPEILPMYVPNVNSYKRLVEGLWAPTRATWGIDNRTTALRVLGGSSKSTRLETRVGGADINPYIAVAAALASGLYGIEKKLTLSTPPIEGNAYQSPVAAQCVRLSKDLGEAAEKMSQSKVARELFGEGFVDHFVRTRKWEFEKQQQAVTNWELERYFEII